MVNLWYLIIIGISLLLGLSHFLLKYASFKLGGDSFVITALVSIFAALIPLFIVLIKRKELFANKGILLPAIIGGLLIGVYSIGLVTVFKHAPVSIVTPTVLILASVTAVILGFLFLNEQFTLIKWAGFILLLTGAYLFLRF